LPCRIFFHFARSRAANILEVAVSQANRLNPSFDERLPNRCFPILFEIGMALGAQPTTIMMAETTLERLVTGAIKFAPIPLEKVAAIFRKFIRGKRSFATLEGRRKHTKREFGRNLQHHAISVACFHSLPRFFYSPPAWARAVAQTNLTCA